jgi:hypothetical protein
MDEISFHQICDEKLKVYRKYPEFEVSGEILLENSQRWSMASPPRV